MLIEGQSEFKTRKAGAEYKNMPEVDILQNHQMGAVWC